MRIILLSFVFLFIATSHAMAQSGKPTHPMDALTPGEIEAAVALLVKQKLADDQTRYPVMELYEPAKQGVLSWQTGQPFTRAARISMRRGGRTFEAFINLTKGEIIQHREVAGAQPSIMQAEWDLARQLTKADPRWLKAMQKRRLTDPAKIVCTPLPAGYREAADQTARRLIKVPCFAQINKLHPLHARPIEGVIAVVDPEAKEVVKVIDTGLIVPITEPPSDYSALTKDPPINPVMQALPGGTNIKITGNHLIEWQNWSFHLRADRRAGAILSLVRFNDRGADRLIAYQMSIAEMFVPYMDPDETWAFRGYLDAGELGLGYLISSLNPGQDCPRQSFYINLLVPSDQGGMFRAPRALCVFERATGDPAWRHYDPASQTAISKPEIELVVRHIPTIGNYDYVVDYVFQKRGNIKFRLGATGLDATRSVTSRDMTSDNALKETRFGALVAPYTVAPYHDHFISYRLDLDVDGTSNVFIRDQVEPRSLKKEHQRAGLWILRSEGKGTEGPVIKKPGSHGHVWRLSNQNKKTSLGHNPSYQIEPGHEV